MTVDEYYTAPPQEVFDDIKRASIELWVEITQEGYANGLTDYREEKLSRIRDIENIQDNAWYIVSMLDRRNMYRLTEMVSEETRDYILRAMSPN